MGPATLAASILIASGNTLEALGGAFLLRRIAKVHGTLNQPSKVYKFVIVGAVMCLISAGIGSISLVLLELVPRAALWTIASTWWVGDLAGVLIMTPFLLARSVPVKDRLDTVRLLEIMPSLTALVLLLFLVFGQHFSADLMSRQSAYLLLPCVGWAAYRYGSRGVTLVLLLVAGGAVWGTTRGFGPFATGTLNDALLALEIFIALSSVIGMVLAADLEDNATSTGKRHKAGMVFMHWMTLFLCLALTMAAWHFIASGTEHHAHDRFESEVDNIEKRIGERMQAYEQVLRGGQSFFNASPEVDRDDWRHYVNSLRVDQNYPGIQGIGFVKRVPAAHKGAFEADIQAENFPDFRIWPPGERDQYFPIVYLEPFSGKNQRAFGYDLSFGQRNVLGALRLLVVDDNASSRTYLGRLIQAWHWEADTVESGEQAIACILKREAAGERYDVVLADWQMPGMDGIATMQAIRALPLGGVAPIVIMLSAFGRGKLMQLEAATEVDAFLTKPVNASSLFDTLHELLTRHRACAGAVTHVPAFARPFDRCLDAHLLLVEDNPLNQTVAKAMLEQAGAKVEVVGNGQQAVDLLRTEPDRFQLVLMDVQMPVMDGFTATRIIRHELGLDLPIVAMTAGVMETEREQCTASGMNDFIAKPIEAEKFFSVISRHLPAMAGAKKLSGMVATSSVDGVFDVRALMAVTANNDDHRRTSLRQIRSTLEHGPAQLAQARQSWQAKQPDDAARLLHSMRGAIGTLGAQRFATAAAGLEKALGQDDAVAVDTMFAEVARELEATTMAGNAWLAMQDTAATGVGNMGKMAYTEQLALLKRLLTEHDLAACDVYLVLQAALANDLADDNAAALESALDRLAFDEALRILERTRSLAPAKQATNE